MGIGQVLIEIRLERGFLTAKEFYNYLKSRNLDCNYQYYAKIEKNIILPSFTVINQIAKSLKKSEAEYLIKISCASMFKNYDYLFEVSETKIKSENKIKETIDPTINKQGQKILTESQVAIIANNKTNYYLFLMMTLARKPLVHDEIKKLRHVKSAIEELLHAKILIKNKNNEIQSSSSEFSFPKENSIQLSNYYSKLDEWDREFGPSFEFDKLVNKMMIRRISPRYLNLIKKHIDMLIELIRTSDESDIQYNDQVIQLSFQLSHGKIAG